VIRAGRRPSHFGGRRGGDSQRLWLDRSRHLVGVDVEKALVADTVASFLASHGRW
jgi:hypothetical protein